MKRKKILFVCTGNTCRSPMAETILRGKIKQRKIKWWDVASCGLFAEVGSSMSENCRRALDEIGFKNDKFVPRQLTQVMMEKSYAVICMTDKQKQIIDECGNVFSIRELFGDEIPDPYGCDIEIYRLTCEALCRACDIIIEKIILAYDGGAEEK